MGQVDAIYRRRSIRKYLNEELQVGVLDEIKEMCKGVKKLYGGIDMGIHVVEEGTKIQKIITGIIGSYGKIKAPHYVVVTSDKQEGYLENSGFAIESIVLYLTDMGIGTCFVGSGINKQLLESTVQINKNHEVVIIIAFGYPRNEEDMNKKAARYGKRMEISEFTSGYVTKAWQHILDAFRMAPSPINSQPWRVFINKDSVDIYCINKNFLLMKNLGEMNLIAIGTALYHLYIAAERMDMEIDIKRLPGKEKDNHTYITSVIEI